MAEQILGLFCDPPIVIARLGGAKVIGLVDQAETGICRSTEREWHPMRLPLELVPSR